MDNSAKQILVVEDEESLRNMLVMVFEDEGYQVGAAENGREAWSLINANHFDLLVTDLYMPEMNGVELIIQCQSSFPSMKIIMLSGGGRDLDAEHGKQSITLKGQKVNVDLFMKKPCNLNYLLSCVEGLLES